MDYDDFGRIRRLLHYDGKGRAIDSLAYQYLNNTGRLGHVRDGVGSAVSGNDVDNQMPNNYAYDALGKRMATARFGIGNANYPRYFYTGQEYDEETGLYNFRARLYDDELFRFYAIDPAGQQFSGYAFVGNSPLMYVDKDGEWFFIAVVLAVGAGANVASNWDDINQNGFNFGKFLGYAAVGAASSAVNLAMPGLGGALIGGGLSGFSNTLIGDGNIGDALKNGALGAGIGGAGYGIGKAIQPYIGKAMNAMTINGTPLTGSMPALSGGISTGIGGAATGGIVGGTMSVANGGSFGEGFWKEARSGAISGFAQGFAIAGAQAMGQGQNPFYNAPKGQMGENHNAANYQKLKERLTLESAKSPFNDDGTLTNSAVNESKSIIEGSKLNNTIQKEISNFGDIQDWSKNSLGGFSSPSGPFEVHFYFNSKTGQVYYNRDYKIKFQGKR